MCAPAQCLSCTLFAALYDPKAVALKGRNHTKRGSCLLILGQTPEQLKAQTGSHLNMLVLATATQPTTVKSMSLCNVTTIVTGIQVFCQRQSPYSMNSSGLRPQKLHPCAVCTSDSVHWPVSCFAHSLTWQACQLVHAGDDFKHQRALRNLIQRDPKVTSLFTGVNALPRELPRHPHSSPSQQVAQP